MTEQDSLSSVANGTNVENQREGDPGDLGRPPEKQEFAEPTVEGEEKPEDFFERKDETPDLKALGESEIGPTDPFVRPDIAVELKPSRQVPIAGELWSMLGTIKNRSEIPIWIVDVRTQLTIAPEMWGLTSTRGSIGAFFPTVRTRPSDEIIRIDPQCEYCVVWKIDTFGVPEHERKANFLEVFQRIFSSVRDFAFFNPGKFTVSATTHVWTVPPTIDEMGRVINAGGSLPITVSSEVEMEASHWVLIVGAVLGGVLSFVLQLLASYSELQTEGSLGPELLTAMIGLLVAVLLPAIVTILLTRLATTDFLLVVKVRDIWGAIATGFIVQWFGMTVLAKLLESVSFGL